MNSDNDLLHQPQPINQKPTSSFKPLKPLALLAASLFIAVVAGTGGYLLGKRTTPSTPLQPTFTNLLTSTQTPTPTPTEIPTPAPASRISTVPTITSISDPTANWKTYTNQQYGFEIKYPPDAQINTDNTTDVLSNMPIEMGLSIKPVGTKGVLLINVITNQSGSTYDIPGPCYATTLGSQPDKETINGNNFVVWDIGKNLSMGVGNWGVGNEYCTVHNANRYDLIPEIFYTPNTQSPSIEPNFNQILSTFKFLDQNPK